ncbi:MAG: hypothetical protein ACXVKA_13415 [Acidimicrobiia bacterium]
MGEGNTTQDQACTADNVVVDGHQAVWIYSEFETDRSLKDLVAWLTPDNWPSWGGEMFKEMRPVTARTDIPTPGGRQWHASYLEVVSLAGIELNTVLRCDFKQTKTWAAMTYDLDHSIGDLLQVDRGYLVAIDVGDRRLVKALKVVGFTDTLLNVQASEVCPEWGTWIRDATADAPRIATEASLGPVPPGGIGDEGELADEPESDGATAFTEGYGEVWADAVSDMAHWYAEYATDVGRRTWSGKYGRTDAAHDGTRLFLRLARDWSRAWQASTDYVSNLAEADVEPTAGAPVSNGRTVEFTTLVVPVPAEPGPVVVSELVRVSDEPARIPATALKVTPPTIGPDADPPSVRVTVNTTDLPCGLYEGSVLAGGGAKPSKAPALLYVGKARRI